MPFTKDFTKNTDQESLPEALGISKERGEVIAKVVTKIVVKHNRNDKALKELITNFDDNELVLAIYLFGCWVGSFVAPRIEKIKKANSDFEEMLNELKETDSELGGLVGSLEKVIRGLSK